jgi:hypothetical protein
MKNRTDKRAVDLLKEREAAARSNGRQRPASTADFPHCMPPDAPPGEEPADQSRTPGPWRPPIPLSTLPQVEPFPIEVLPSKLAAFIKEIAATQNCPPDFVAVPMLVIAGGAIGLSRILQIKAEFKPTACLYAAILGVPGSGKTPALEAAARPVWDEQERRMRGWQSENQANGEGGHAWPDSTLRPSTLWVADITAEKLAEELHKNARGLTLIRDELSAWFASMNQYKAHGRGSDRQFFLSLWSGSPISVHRKSQENGPLVLGRSFLAVVGGLPPGELVRMRAELRTTDGSLDRILFAYPESLPAIGEDWADVDPRLVQVWPEVLQRLWRLAPEPASGGDTRPHFVRLSHSGRKSWERFRQQHADEVNAESFPDILRGPWFKLIGYCGRLALIIHQLRVATEEAVHEDVDGDSVDRAAQLVRYFKSHARKVYAAVDADPRTADARRVLCLIEQDGLKRFSKRHAHHALGGRFKTAEELNAPLSILCNNGFIRPVPPPERPGPGRKPGPVYDVNPLLWASTESTESTESPLRHNSVDSVDSVDALGRQREQSSGALQHGIPTGGELATVAVESEVVAKTILPPVTDVGTGSSSIPLPRRHPCCPPPGVHRREFSCLQQYKGCLDNHHCAGTCTPVPPPRCHYQPPWRTPRGGVGLWNSPARPRPLQCRLGGLTARQGATLGGQPVPSIGRRAPGLSGCGSPAGIALRPC